MKTTIIIPTLFKKPETLKDIINQFKNKYNIHIIDNSPGSNCKIFEKDCFVSYFRQNIGVNPAWNFGIQNCKTEYYVLLNDDIILNKNIIEIGEEILEDITIGLVSFKTLEHIEKKIYNSLYKNSKNIPNIVNVTDLSLEKRQGWFMMGRTKEYYFIPDELKIFFGDDLLYKYIRSKNLRTIIDTNNKISHFTSSSVNTINHKNIFESEKYFYEGIINDVGL
jgi:hypothetical protein